MKLKVEINNVNMLLQNRNLEKRGRARQVIDSEVLRLCEPYVPRDSGELIASGRLNTVIGSGKVSYNTPYARRWYYEPASFDGAPRRGNYWFENMKNNGGTRKILSKIASETGGKAK